MTKYSKNSKLIWNFFVNNHRISFIIIAALVLVGIISMFNMVKESAPDVDIPIAIINTSYPGANAEDVEKLVTDIIEKNLVNLNDVEEISSNSSRGFSSIVVQFNAQSNSLEKIIDLKDKIDEVKVDLPDDANDPIVRKIRLDDLPVLRFSLSGDYDLFELSSYAESLQNDIERVAGVSDVDVFGGLTREIKINVNRALLDAYSISISDVSRAISRSDTDIPIGVIESLETNYNLRLSGKISSLDEIKNIPIKNIENTVIVLSDIAEVVDDFERSQSISRLSVEGDLSQNSVSLQVYKVSGADTVRTIDRVNQIIDDAQKSYLADDISIQSIQDDAVTISRDLNELLVSGIQTILIVLLVLILFLGWKEAVLASLVVPLSYLASFIILYSIGYTLNVLTLFSLILALGILVDSSIVIIEAIYQEMKTEKDTKKAVLTALAKYSRPLTAGVLTTVFTFAPMIFVSGIMGEFIRSIPVTVIVVLLSSLFVSLGIITTLSYFVLRHKKDTEGELEIKEKKKSYFQNLMESFKLWYLGILNTYLYSKKKQIKLSLITVFLLIFSFSLFPLGLLKVNMFPDNDEVNIYIDIKAPTGTILLNTDKYLQDIENLLYQDERIQSFVSTTGSSASGGSVFASGGTDSHLGGIVINLIDGKRDSSVDIVKEYQDLLSDLFDASIEVSVYQLGYGPGSSAPVEFRVFGDSLEGLDQLSKELFDIVENTPGTINVKRSIEDTSGEFVIYINRSKAQLYNISTQEVASILRTALYGSDVLTISLDDQDDVNVLLKYAFNSSDLFSNNQINISDIERLSIQTSSGEIPLSAFAEIRLENDYFNIEHFNNERVATVSGDLVAGYNAQQVFSEIESQISAINTNENYRISSGGERESVNDSFSDLISLLFVGVFLIIGLLTWQLNSFRQPLFIIVSIILSLIGVFIGLVMVNLSLSFPALIGVVALAGIVVNNAIILIDQINKNRIIGMNKYEAIYQAASLRFQPIILTTITTIAGILPLALSNPIWGPLAYSIVFGLAFSTVLTLLVIPILYLAFYKSEIEAN